MTRALITRDSVCAGDDLDGQHAREFDYPDGISIHKLITLLIEEYSLPQIGGGNATWCLTSRVPLVVIAQQWESPKFLMSVEPSVNDLNVQGRAVHFHVSYFGQRDPEAVFSVLERLRFPSSSSN